MQSTIYFASLAARYGVRLAIRNCTVNYSKNFSRINYDNLVNSLIGILLALIR